MRWPAFLIAAVLAGQTTGDAGIEGTVVDKVTGGAVRNAVVFVYRHQPPLNAQAMTDGSGRFRFDGLQAAGYTLEVRHPQYPFEHNAVAEIRLNAGERRTGVTLAITPSGAVGGRVSDKEGDPIERCDVRAYSYGLDNGERNLTQAYNAQTDDDGEYRLFHVKPGRYFVGVTCPALGRRPHGLMSQAEAEQLPQQGYQRQFWGGAEDAEKSTALLVRPGAELQNVDFRLEQIAVHTVSGTVANAVGQQFFQVVLTPANPNSVPVVRYIGSAHKGAFRVNGVPAGTYYTSHMGFQNRVLLSRVRVEVPQDGSQPLHLEPAPAFDWPVIIEHDGADAAFQITSIELLTTDELRPPLRARQNPDGSFVVAGVPPGLLKLRIQGTRPDFIVKSVRAGNQDLQPNGFEITSPVADPLKITVSRKVPVVSGVLIPESEDRSTQIRVIAVGDRGEVYIHSNWQGTRLEWSGLPPGNHKLLAARVSDAGVLADPAVLKELSGYMQSVTLAEGSKVQVELKVVPEETLARLCVY